MAIANISISFDLGTLVNSLKRRALKKHSRTKNKRKLRYKDMTGIANKSLSKSKIKKRFRN
ncbi:hypothetical protein [Poseidonibacter sp.]|uniref:hypothetical protein n=1 Tax=Poseidonibacter sp. TaxID=2321188 RepID=UPI003C738990